jgi:glutathione synthase/RimK-type ligase-like ATP-grasp enzyme
MSNDHSVNHLIGSWLHAREEDQADVTVYRPEDYPLPPARGRESITFEADGTVTLGRPGRITIIGEKVFPAAIHSQQTDYPVDSRIDFANAKVEAVEIPDKVESQLLDLVGRLGLRYGAVDMRLTPDGKYVLLEINPAGQFRYIEAATGQPMTATMAALLLSGDRA